MMLRPSSLLALLLAAPLAVSQTATQTATAAAPVWSTLASESDIAVTIPAGSTYRLGDTQHNLWSAPVTVTTATTFRPLSYPAGQFPFADPDPGTVKELDLLETTTSQSVTIVNFDLMTTISQVVPALVPPPVVPLLPGTGHTVTFSNFSTPASAGQNALMFAFVNAPSNLANRTWEGTQMNLNIDGVTMTCTYGQTYTDGVFSLSCTVPSSTPASGAARPGQ